jgi:hypothetical protein
MGIFGTKEERVEDKAERRIWREEAKAAATAAAYRQAQARVEQMQHRNELARKVADADGAFQGLYVLPDQLVRLDKVHARSYPIAGASASIDVHPPITYQGTTYYFKADLHVEGDGFAWTIPFHVDAAGKVPDEAHRFVNALKAVSRTRS